MLNPARERTFVFELLVDEFVRQLRTQSFAKEIVEYQPHENGALKIINAKIVVCNRLSETIAVS